MQVMAILHAGLFHDKLLYLLSVYPHRYSIQRQPETIEMCIRDRVYAEPVNQQLRQMTGSDNERSSDEEMACTPVFGDLLSETSCFDGERTGWRYDFF